MFQLSSDITIGNFRFSGVHEVQIRRSIHSYVDIATITLPAKAQVNKDGKVVSQNIITGKQFTDGDPVTINLGYNGLLINEFKGFVTSRDLDTPLQVHCEGYSYQLKRNNITGSYPNVTVKDLLQKAIQNTDIKVHCTVDMTLVNFELKDVKGTNVIDTIMEETDNNLRIFFIQPNVLWCGFVYTPYANGTDVFDLGKASYRLGYNVLRENNLKQRLPQDDPGTHIYVKKTATGVKLQGQSQDIPGALRKYKKSLNRMADADSLNSLAQEHQYLENYTGYEGNLNAFLQPWCCPGFQAWVSDDNYPERDGYYLVESTEVTFGVRGARRKIGVGPLIGFGKNNNTTS